MSDWQVQRGIAAVRLIKGIGGVIAGIVLIVLGATGQIIPAQGLPESAEWGKAIGDEGVRIAAVVSGCLAALFFGRWVLQAIGVLRIRQRP